MRELNLILICCFGSQFWLHFWGKREITLFFLLSLSPSLCRLVCLHAIYSNKIIFGQIIKIIAIINSTVPSSIDDGHSHTMYWLICIYVYIFWNWLDRFHKYINIYLNGYRGKKKAFAYCLHASAVCIAILFKYVCYICMQIHMTTITIQYIVYLLFYFINFISSFDSQRWVYKIPTYTIYPNNILAHWFGFDLLSLLSIRFIYNSIQYNYYKLF